MFSVYFQSLKSESLKICIKYAAINWNIAHCIWYCDTCDSKKTKTPVLCVCAHARERVITGIFTLPTWGCWFPIHSSVYFHFWTFIENNTLFCEKWAVVLWKTTRHFVENKPSFCESIMHFRTDKIDYLVVLRWKQLNFLCSHPWPLARKRPILPRLRGKTGLYLWLSPLPTRWFHRCFNTNRSGGNACYVLLPMRFVSLQRHKLT